MHEYLIALGSNLGDREYYMEQAIEAIRTNCGPIRRLASSVETQPLGAADRPFLNSALISTTELEPLALLDQLLWIEQDLGRTRSIRWGNRTIDCDIILWRRGTHDFPVVCEPRLTIPHPEALHRSFVLEPAAEIAGEWLHPLAGQSLAALWASWQLTQAADSPQLG